MLTRGPRRRIVDPGRAGQFLLERGLDLGDLQQLGEVEPDAVVGRQDLGHLDGVLDLPAVEVYLGQPRKNIRSPDDTMYRSRFTNSATHSAVRVLPTPGGPCSTHTSLSPLPLTMSSKP